MFLTHIEGNAISYKDNKISYKLLISQVHKFASLYTINEEDRVIIFSENRPSWIYAFHSIWHNSGIALPVDFMSTPKELLYILKDSKPKIIFYSQERIEVLT